MKPVWKMTIFILLLIIFFVAYGGIMDSQLTHIANLVQVLHDHPMEVTKDTLTASRDLVTISRDIKDMILVADPAHRSMRLTEIDFLDKSIKANMHLVADRVAGDEGMALVKTAEDLIKEESVLRRKIIGHILDCETDKAAHLARYDGTALMKKIEEAMGKITNYAVALSMSYHVESITTLKRSKIILFSSGFIIVIVSVLFTVLVGLSARRSLNRPKDALVKSLELPIIDLTMRIKPPSISGMSRALNEFTRRLHETMSGIANLSSQLALAAGSQNDKNQLSQSIDKINSKVEPLIEKASLLTEKQHYSERSQRILLEMLNQISGDLTLLAQSVASQTLIIDELELQKADPENMKKMLGKLKDHGRNLTAHVEQSARSVRGLSELLVSLANHISKLILLSKEQANVAIDIHDFFELSKAYDFQFAQIRDISLRLQKSLETIKL
jgi:hypothetical protein